MSVVIRMKRTGRRNRPCYRISVADKRWPRDGRSLEILGLYDPISPQPERRVSLNAERARYWLSVGAQPSDTTRSIFKREGVFQGLEAPKRKRVRPGRKKQTATRTRREEEEAARLAIKAQRRQARLAAKRAAASQEEASADA